MASVRPKRSSTVARRVAVAVGMTGAMEALLVLGACDREHDARVEEDTHVAAQRLVATDFDGTSLSDKQLVLTFDDGPGPQTAELSAYLKSEDIHATFFVNGACIATTALPNPGCDTPTPNAVAILEQVADDGHVIANHTTTHRSLTGASSTPVVPVDQRTQELAETDALIGPFTSYDRLFFRAPYGDFSAAVAASLATSAMSKYVGPIGWDMGGTSDAYPASAADWACWQGQLRTSGGALANGNGYATTEQCGDAYLMEIAQVGRGIVLLHDPYAWSQGSTVDMVRYLVPKLKAAGYSFVSLSEVPSIAAALPACDASAEAGSPDAGAPDDASVDADMPDDAASDADAPDDASIDADMPDDASVDADMPDDASVDADTPDDASIDDASGDAGASDDGSVDVGGPDDEPIRAFGDAASGTSVVIDDAASDGVGVTDGGHASGCSSSGAPLHASRPAPVLFVLFAMLAVFVRC